ncbi:ATP-binding protein [Acidovorax sp. FG27]|uniref:sensor histidine kinase n=1 Tax=Acidovorax sp. FG27 TaxID=3133652 RepID=UPI00333FC2CE
MHEHSQKLTFRWFRAASLRRVCCWLLVAFAVLETLGCAAGTRDDDSRPPSGMQGRLSVERINDPTHALTPADIAAAGEGRIVPNMQLPLSAGYVSQTVWLRFHSPGADGGPTSTLWLLAGPSYVDSITLYQPDESAPGSWKAQASGDLVPGREKAGVRQPLFELQPHQLTLVRIRTTSAMQFDARVLTDSQLRQTLVEDERHQGLFFGVLFALLAAVVGAAAIFRTPQLYGLAGLCTVGCIHIFNLHGYLSLWVPATMTEWASHAVGMGAFALTSALAWQIRLQLTSAQQHRSMRKALSVVACLACAGAISPVVGLYGSVAWMNLVLMGACDAMAITLCVATLHRHRRSTVHAVLLAAYMVHAASGILPTFSLLGWFRMEVNATLVWQTESLLFMLLTACAVFVEMVLRYRKATEAQTAALRHLAQSEQILEQRVERRTTDALRAQAALAQALESERALRQEQRQFFQMISHEFRTPLAVIDSAASEQLSFPTHALEGQMERASQIRRACRRLTSLVDSCLITDRMDASGFHIFPTMVAVNELLEHAAQLVRWSPRHQLRLVTHEAPDQWMCDATLVRIALSNLVDNAVKHARGGEIVVTAAVNTTGQLEFSVSDEGHGISPESIQRMFEQFERGDRTDRTQGFGLGLWVARRVARLHGGDIDVASQIGRGTCFTLTIARQRAAS